MTADRWHRMEELFTQALERPASERAGFLDGALAGDQAMRAEVERLLATYGEASGFLEPDSPERAHVLQAIEDSLRIGSSFGPYRIQELLGEGGMGVVYRARDMRNDVDVAIKVLRPEALADPAARKRFTQECRVVATLNHAGIVRVHDSGREDGLDYLVMEFVGGRTLRDRIEAGPLPYPEALRYACQIAGALAAAHGQGVFHRDIKPANVMITPAGSVKVLDFGLCQWSENRPDGASSVHTQAGMLLGTAAYMSPEQAQGMPTGASSDIFSFGALLYEMIAGRQAFAEPTTVGTLAAILYREPPPDARIPHEVAPLIAQCLKKDPAQRFQTVSAVQAALRRLEEVQGGGPLPRAVVRTRAALWNRRTAMLKSVVAAGAMAGLAWLGWGAFHRTPHAPVQTIVTPDYSLSMDPAVSPDGRTLAYASDRGGSGRLDIWLQPLPTGTAVPLVQAGIDAREPSFSPDGKTVVFRLEREAGEVCTVPASGGPQKRIAVRGRRPRFSPDGKWIAYWTGPEGSSELLQPGVAKVWVVSSAGGEPHAIAPELPAATHPIWAPDSTAVLIPANVTTPSGPQGVGIWLAPVDGRPARLAIPPSRFKEWTIGGQPAALKLFFQSGFPVGVSRTGGVIIPTPIENRTEIWEFPLTPHTWMSSGPPRQVTTVVDQAGFPTFGSDNSVFFEEPARKASLVELPFDFATAAPSGPPRELVACPVGYCLPYLPRDGDKVVYAMCCSQKDKGWGVHSRDLGPGRDTTLAAGGASAFVGVTADGKQAYFSEESEASFDRNAPLYRADTAGGSAEVVCQSCPHLRDISADGRYALAIDFKPRQVVLVDVQTGAATSLLKHPTWGLYRGRFSPDGRWIAFLARGGSPGQRILVSPFHPGRDHPPSEWIAITTGEGNDGPVVWSPGGDALVYASERDGYRCLYLQKVDGATKRPIGGPQTIQHFHDARASLKNVPSGVFNFAVARGKIVYELGERTGRIWMTR